MSVEYMTRKEAALYLNCSVSLLEQLAWRNEGPLFFKLGHKTTRYHLSDLNIWLEARKARKHGNAKN